MNLSRHYTRIWSRICTYNNNNNDNNTLTYNNKLYTIILCSLHAMCQNILQQRTHAVQTVIYVYSLQTHLQERYTLCVFLGCLYMPTLSPVYCTAHIYDIYSARVRKRKKKLLCGFYEIFRTRLPAYFPVLILIQWCEWCAFYASFPNGCPHLTGSNFFYKYFLSYELWLLWLRRK